MQIQVDSLSSAITALSTSSVLTYSESRHQKHKLNMNHAKGTGACAQALQKKTDSARWEVCRLDDPWCFAASNSLMYSIHRCTWKSLQFFTIIIMMATFMRLS